MTDQQTPDVLHPKRELPEPEQKSPAVADEKEQSTPTADCQKSSTCPEETSSHQRVKMVDVNSSLTCELCRGYLIDATTISECLHSFCRSCIIDFLQENSFCPVCEVIINKAKPNLKLDKTLQDIVYKLVPGLFLSEMMRRRRFYADRPLEVGRTSPEQRGEDTERTIFNPQDRISLSLEYIGDEATTGLILKDLKQKVNAAEDAQAESLLKRYLQCPAMCRIDVIKKFIRNKYNVNTDLFQIDILYKRVPLPLPDHYTLVDVAYIYTWKRNEPMRFYFRIIDNGNDELPDLTKIFTPVEDAIVLPKPTALATPKVKTASKDRPRKTPKRSASKKLPIAKPKAIKEDEICDKKMPEEEEDLRGRKRYVSESEREGCDDKMPKLEEVETEDCPKSAPIENAAEICDSKVYTNITLNRSNNSEIVTKVHANQIEVTVKKEVEEYGDATEIASEKVEVKIETVPIVPTETKREEEEKPSSETIETKAEPQAPSAQPSPPPEVSSTTTCEEELEKTKFEFLKSIELTSKKVVDDLARLAQQQNAKAEVENKEKPQGSEPSEKEVKKAPGKPEGNGLKRKNPSPVKIEPKKVKSEPKRTTKIILQQKPGFPTLNLSKPPEKTTDQTVKSNRNELRNLFQNCKLNIPASLSITLKENGETSRQPMLIPPVQNFIEILKIDEKAGTPTVKDVKNTALDFHSRIPKNVAATNSQMDQTKKKRKEPSDKQSKEQQSFQKIFEESIKKSEDGEAKRPPVPHSSRGIVAKPPIATSKVAIPRLPTDKTMKPPKKIQKCEPVANQTLTNLHSSSLGLNYTVSVGKQQRELMKPTGSNGFPKNAEGLLKVPFPNISEQPKKTCPISPRTVELKAEGDQPRSFSVPHSPRPSVSSPRLSNPSPRPTIPSSSPNQSGLQLQMSSPKIYTPQKSGSKTASPRPKSTAAPPKSTAASPKSTAASPKSRTNVSPGPSSSSSGPPSSSSGVPPLTANELLEKYNIQNLAQLSATMNYNAQAYLSSMSNKQMSALHQSMLMKQMEAQNRQNWFNINPLPLLQYEKYLQTLNATKNQIMGNMKEN